MENQHQDQVLNGTHSKYYPGGIKYTGPWENGLKVGEGTIENNALKLKVKIKDGRIYKCTQVLEIFRPFHIPIPKFALPDIIILKEGGNYREYISSDNQNSFFFEENIPLFDGKPCSNFKVGKIRDTFRAIYGLQGNKNTKIVAIEIIGRTIRFIGTFFNLNPNGPFKVYSMDFTIKGTMKGFLLVGKCSIKNDMFKVILNANSNQIEPKKVTSKVLNFEASLSYSPYTKCIKIQQIGMNLEIANSLIPDIKKFISLSYYQHERIIKFVQNFLSVSSIVSYSLIKKSWRSIEQDMYDKERYLKLDQDENPSESNEIALIKFPNKEIFRGKIVEGEYEGLGKYCYKDGSVYVGEFRSNMRNGLGTFRFRDGRLYKGYWKDDLMHGKGFLVNEGVKISGFWEKNKLDEKSVCLYHDLNV